MLRLLLPVLVLLLGACATAPAPAPPARVAGPTGIAGTVVLRGGEPAAGAYVYAYRSAGSGLRGPADFEAGVDGAGRYFLDLAPGRYYLVARSRQGGGHAGPPRAGDAWALHPGNPLAVEEGATSRADFLLQGVAKPMLLRRGSLADGTTGFSGRIVDGDGRPVPGAFAAAYRDGDFKRMPDYTSAVVGEDGAFTLYVAEGGRYCLVARTRTRGQPVAGELYGLLGPGEGGCREVGDGEIREVGTIVVEPYRR